MESRQVINTRWGRVVHGDVSVEFWALKPAVLCVDLETDRCNFERPDFWHHPETGAEAFTRLITVYDPVHDVCEFVRVGEGSYPTRLWDVLRLAQSVYFHHAMFDLTFLAKDFNIWVSRPRCTKILAKAAKGLGSLRGDSVRLKALLREYFEVEYPKDEAVSSWTAPELSNSQLEYAWLDVAHLTRLYDKLQEDVLYSSMDDVLGLIDQHERHLKAMVHSRLLGHFNVFEH